MEYIAKDLSNNNKNINLIPLSSSAQVLQQLKNKKIDVALIGRIAKNYEIETSTQEKRLKEGYTLITRHKNFIQYNDLSKIKIHTSLEENIANELISNGNFIFYNNLEESINNGLDESVLIDWKDYKDEYNLLVVMNGSNKVEQFRLPTLYSNNYDLDRIKVE